MKVGLFENCCKVHSLDRMMNIDVIWYSTYDD